MAKRLFVGGLPYETTDIQLKEVFEKIGKVISANVIVDKFSGRSKGFGFVEFETEEDAAKAITELNDTEMGGRKLLVQEARPMEERAPRRDFGGGDRRGGYGGGRDDRRGGGRSGYGGGRGGRF